MLAGGKAIASVVIEMVRDFAAATNIGVANTWDAKGLFAWDSPHHLGTCGLQANDFDLLGWSAVDLIITTGRPDLALGDAFIAEKLSAWAPILNIDPEDLASLANEIHSVTAPDNRLYSQLATIAQPGYTDERVPLHPARAAANLGRALPGGGLLTAEPGIVGLWIARTFPTPALNANEPPRVLVPTFRGHDEAVRQSLAAANAGRPTICVLSSPLGTEAQSLIKTATTSGLNLVIDVWTNEKSGFEKASDHYDNLTSAISAGGVHIIETAIEFSCTNDLIAAAGEVVAWGGLSPTETSRIEP